jgi:heptosyltransferase-2
VNTLVRVSNWLGDAVMNTAALEALKDSDPGGRLTVLAIPWVADVFLHHPAVDEILTYDRKAKHAGFRGMRETARRLKAKDFDRAYVFPNSFSSAFILYLARIPKRIGYRGHRRGFLLTHVRPFPEDVARQHQARHYLHLLEVKDPGRYEPRVFISPEEQEPAKQRLLESGLDPGDGVVGLSPGAAFGPAKRWFPERFAETAREIQNRCKCGIVILGSDADKEVGDRVAAEVPAPCLDLCGKTGLRELMALLSVCRLLVTNDSGTMHLAAALGVPVVAIFGSTDPEATGPTGEHVRVIRHPIECSPCFERTCPYGHYRCMKLVEASEVAQAASDLLERKPNG